MRRGLEIVALLFAATVAVRKDEWMANGVDGTRLDRGFCAGEETTDDGIKGQFTPEKGNVLRDKRL